MSMPTTTRSTARQRGLIRRFRRRDDLMAFEDLMPAGSGPRPTDIVDVRPVTEPDLQALSFRLEKLEAGVRMIVDTTKRAYGELATSIETLARQLDVADARTTVERIVAEEVGPLTTSIRELADTVQRFPHILAAAMDDMGLRIDTGRWKLEKTLTEGLDALGKVGSTESGSGTNDLDHEKAAMLTPRPFELEPVELQFGGTSQAG
jgi:HAMP domain-containing protein